MLPPCSCNNCPICAERLADELLAKYTPRGREAQAKLVTGVKMLVRNSLEADAWFNWAVALVDALGLSAGPRENEADVDGWSVDELRDRIERLAMLAQPLIASIEAYAQCEHPEASRLGANIKWCRRCGALFDRGEWHRAGKGTDDGEDGNKHL